LLDRVDELMGKTRADGRSLGLETAEVRGQEFGKSGAAGEGLETGSLPEPQGAADEAEQAGAGEEELDEEDEIGHLKTHATRKTVLKRHTFELDSEYENKVTAKEFLDIDTCWACERIETKTADLYLALYTKKKGTVL
jgi:hypothetical protein